jgi:hypothetical protein
MAQSFSRRRVPSGTLDIESLRLRPGATQAATFGSEVARSCGFSLENENDVIAERSK